MRLAVATSNPGKLREIALRLAAARSGQVLEFVSLKDFPGFPPAEEDQPTFIGNALKKAHTFATHTGLLTLADDSGLEVEALGGAPGVWSARYAGAGCTYDDNNRRLLAALQGVPPERRGARFICVLALFEPASGREVTVEGECRGRIAEAPRGAHGFGYDPVFEIPALGRTFAELALEEKQRLGHRGAALRKLVAVLPEFV